MKSEKLLMVICRPAIDSTESLKAINNAFQDMSHGARYVLIGLQKRDISFSHPEFDKENIDEQPQCNTARL